MRRHFQQLPKAGFFGTMCQMIKEAFDKHYRDLCEKEELHTEAKAWALLEEVREEINELMEVASGSLPKKLLFLLRGEIEGVF